MSGFDFMISDPQKTPIHEKGMGFQSAALLAAFRWITKQEKSEGREPLWLLEEPESYLHPDLAGNCNSILENLAQDATVIKTTHSMAFVPQNPNHVSGTRLNSKNRTEVESYKTFSEAVSSIRGALGIKFGDFYNLALFNILVEGPTDRELFEWVLDKLPEDSYPLSFVRHSRFEDFGGVKHLSGFLRATYQFIRQEYACVAVFDGDDAGEKERKDLQAYFGQKSIPFEANRHFVSVRSRFAIEGLFPDDWIKTIYEEHPSWFDSFAVDAGGELEPFKVKDGKKSQMQAKLISLAQAEKSLDWAIRFINVFQMIDSALDSLHEKLDN
ncbi:AAA family ATPase [Aquisalimonas sp. 2447]|nr:AAA family ATPase [Aquisalimonas sp. 2447]QIT53873.1 AAA family ATPase [Aquisalimonas sp. 2447]